MITAELGVIYEFGSKRWVMLGQIQALYPAKPPTGLGKRLLEMHVDAVGDWDPEREAFSLDATLYDSKIAFVSFSGDVAVRVRKGETFLFSAGGYHPEFAVPPGFPRLQRVKISLADSKHLKLLLTGYVAITSNTRQIGARMEFFAGFGDFSIEAVLGFDALWEPDVRFLIDFDLEFKLKYKGITFFGVDVSGRFSGPEPKRVKGEWSIDLWLTSISKKFDKTFGADRPPVALPPVDPLPELVAALKDPLSWTAEPPGFTLVSFRKREAQFVHPLGRLGVRQQVLPLGIRLDRFGGAELASAQRYDITSATVGGRAVTSRPPLTRGLRRGRVPEPERRREARAALVRLHARGRHAVADRGDLRAGGGLAAELRRQDLRRRRRAAGEQAARGRCRARSCWRPRSSPRRRARGCATASPPTGRTCRSAPSASCSRAPRTSRSSGRPRPPTPPRCRPPSPGNRWCSRGPLSAGYQFLPWVRSGAAAGYTLPDALKPVLAAPPGKSLTGMPVTLKVNERPPFEVPVRLYGPGDVTGIDDRP